MISKTSETSETLDVRRDRRMRHVTTTGSALAVALFPLVVGVLLAKSVGADPMTPVNALITSGGQRARLSRSQLRTCGGRALRTARVRRVPGRSPLASLPALRGR
ncbi:hypothetical protein ACF06X_13830 [Streptomyces sp. NPDC015346]|uniref:hypothetical protein n=1 Tax=Streptomyces sp. NPDC015346 TaxID=3364954 RepID=UPI003700840F